MTTDRTETRAAGPPYQLPAEIVREHEADLRERLMPLQTDDDVEAAEAAHRQALQAVIEQQEIVAELKRQAARLGMSLEAFNRIIERDPQLAAEVLETHERSERARMRAGVVPSESERVADAGDSMPPPAGIDMERFGRFLAGSGLGNAGDEQASDEGRQERQQKPFDPDEVATQARAMIPVYSRQIWQAMFPPPGYGGRDPRFVHEVKYVPLDRLGEYARLGFTFKPLAPLISDENRPIVCGIHTTLGTICRKRFDSVQDRLLHWRAKHPAEYEAMLFAARQAEERRQEERWELERKQRELELEIQRKQLALLEQQAQELAALRSQTAPPVGRGDRAERVDSDAAETPAANQDQGQSQSQDQEGAQSVPTKSPPLSASPPLGGLTASRGRAYRPPWRPGGS